MGTSRGGARSDRAARPVLLALLALPALPALPAAPALHAAPAGGCAFPPTAEGGAGDAFWAQRMAGADLMRGAVGASGALEGGLPDGLVVVWDTIHGRHGEFVSQVIAGPTPSAVVPHGEPHRSSFFFGDYRGLVGRCSRLGDCPAYVNNSMEWFGDYALAKAVSTLAGRGVAVVVAAGNGGAPVERAKRESALDGAALLVASLAPDGRPSAFTDYGDAVAVAAPADRSMLSHDFDGVPRDFGGTSGAAALVTGALAGYTLLSGHRPGPDGARLLLSGTAAPLPRLPDGHLLGAGMLNAHKMAAVALRVRERCGGLAGCASRLLRDPATYRFEEEAARLLAGARASGAFPECLPGAAGSAGAGAGPGPVPSCGGAARAFDDLRRAGFLDPSRPEAWEALACVRERRFPGGGGAPADFLRAQAARARAREGGRGLAEPLARDLCAGREGARMARYLPEAALARVLGREGCRRRPEILRTALDSLLGGADDWTGDPWALFGRGLADGGTDARSLGRAVRVVGGAGGVPGLRGLLARFLDHGGIGGRALGAVAGVAAGNAGRLPGHGGLLARVLAHDGIDGRALGDVARTVCDHFDEVSGAHELLLRVLVHPRADGFTMRALERAVARNADAIPGSRALLEAVARRRSRRRPEP